MFCPNCGQELPPDANYCPICNTLIKSPPRITSGRPGVITAASILAGIMGGFSIIGAVVFFAGAAFIGTSTFEDAELPFSITVTTGVMAGLGVLLLIFGVLYLLSCNRLWKRRRSGGILGIVLGVIGIASSVFPLQGSTLVGALPDVALIVLILMGWNSLE